MAKTINKSWKTVLASRNINRPQSLDYINALFDDFIELKGDRCFGNDEAMITGIATFEDTPVTIVAQQKGRGIKDAKKYRNGMCLPEGYRKSLRIMKQAEKFGRPIICFIDTPAAYSIAESEERGIAHAIAKNLMEMSRLKTPIVSIVLSQGGSGGAIAIGVANEVWALENAYYSLLPPESFATILWKDDKKGQEAAEIMQSSSKQLLKAGIIDKVIKEPKIGIDKNPEPVYRKLKEELSNFLKKYKPGKNSSKKRLRKFTRFSI